MSTLLRKTFEKTIDGNPATFTRANSYDKMLLFEEYERVQKLKLVESLDMSGVSPEEKLAALHEFDNPPDAEQKPPPDFVSFLKTPRGRHFGFVQCLRKVHGDGSEQLAQSLDLPWDEEFQLMLDLWGLVPKAVANGNAGPAPAGSTATYGDGGAPQVQPNTASYGSDANPLPPATNQTPASQT